MFALLTEGTVTIIATTLFFCKIIIITRIIVLCGFTFHKTPNRYHFYKIPDIMSASFRGATLVAGYRPCFGALVT